MHPEEQHLPFKQMGSTTIFSFEYQGHVLVNSVDKSHVLVVAIQLIWLLLLNILSFNLVPTPSKSLRFTRSRGSSLNQTAVILTNDCQSYTAFSLNVLCSKWPISFFCSSLSPMIVHLCNIFLLNRRVAWMLLTRRWVSRRKMWNSYP